METLSALPAFCKGNSPVIGSFFLQKGPVTQGVNIPFVVILTS